MTSERERAAKFEIVWRKKKGISLLLGLRRSEWLELADDFAEAARREERKRTIEQLAPYLEDQFRHIAEEWLKALDKETA